jgi:hypothetical protein
MAGAPLPQSVEMRITKFRGTTEVRVSSFAECEAHAASFPEKPRKRNENCSSENSSSDNCRRKIPKLKMREKTRRRNCRAKYIIKSIITQSVCTAGALRYADAARGHPLHVARLCA